MPRARFLGLDSEANQLTLAKIQARIPITVEISQVDLPTDAVEGTPFQITAAAGYLWVWAGLLLLWPGLRSLRRILF